MSFSKIFCVWCYSDGTNGPMHERTTAAPGSGYENQVGAILGGLKPLGQQATEFAAQHEGDMMPSGNPPPPGSGLWAGYGTSSPEVYWVHKAV